MQPPADAPPAPEADAIPVQPSPPVPVVQAAHRPTMQEHPAKRTEDEEPEQPEARVTDDGNDNMLEPDTKGPNPTTTPKDVVEELTSYYKWLFGPKPSHDPERVLKHLRKRQLAKATRERPETT